MKCLCEVAAGPGGHSGLLPHPGVWSIRDETEWLTLGSAVPEAISLSLCSQILAHPPPYLQAQAQLAQDDSDLGNSEK